MTDPFTDKVEIPMYTPVRRGLTEEHIASFLSDLPKMLDQHVEEYKPGVFVHPQEYTGCMFGQLRKLAIEADDCVYIEANEFGADVYNRYVDRCRKVLMAAIIGYLSAQLNREDVELR